MIFDLNYLKPVSDPKNIEGAKRKWAESPREGFADAQSFAFVDDSKVTEDEIAEIKVSASTFALVELGRSNASSSSFSLFKGR